MLTGLKFLRVFANVVLGNEDWNDALAVMMTDALQGIARRLGPVSGVFQQVPVFLELDGMTPIRVIIGSGTYYYLANGAIGVISDADPWWDLIPYTGLGQWLSLSSGEYPEVVDVSLEGEIGWKQYGVGVGEVLTPSAVVEDGDGMLLTVAGHPVWDNTAIKRLCRVWKMDPVTSTSEAIYDGDLDILDGAVKVAVDHQFGQASPSLDAADYRVFVHGPCLRKSAAAPTTTHAHLCRLMPVLPDTGDHRCADLNQNIVNTLDGRWLRSERLVVQEAQNVDAVFNGNERWLGSHEEMVTAGTISAGSLIFRHFWGSEDADEDNDEARQFAIFRGTFSTGTPNYSGVRLFQEDGSDATDIGSVDADEIVHLYMGGPGDLGLAATHPSEAALSVIRNGTRAVLDKVEPTGGAQADETESGLKAVHKVGDLQLLGANGKLVTRCLPVHAASIALGFKVNNEGTPILPILVQDGTTDGEAFLGWEAIVGRKLVKVTTHIYASGATGKIEARLYRHSRTGGLEFLGAAVEWTVGEDTAKDVTPTSETVYEAGYHYGLRIAYATATVPADTSALVTADIVERLFTLQ